jgi:hypothetical protein
MGHLTEGNTGRKGAGGGMAVMDQRGSGLEFGCGRSRTQRGKAWAQNGTGGGRGSSWALFIGRGSKARGQGGDTIAAYGGKGRQSSASLMGEERRRGLLGFVEWGAWCGGTSTDGG